MAASKSALIRDFIIFVLKLTVDGFKDVFLLQASVVTVILDLVFRLLGWKTHMFYAVMRLGERFDLWLNLHGALSRMDDSEDGLFAGSRAGSPTMLGRLEQAVRGGDEPRRPRRPAPPGGPVKRPPPRRS